MVLSTVKYKSNKTKLPRQKKKKHMETCNTKKRKERKKEKKKEEKSECKKRRGDLDGGQGRLASRWTCVGRSDFED